MPPKVFRFKLQTVLDLKQKIEDDEKEKLAKLIQEKIREEQVLERLKQAEIQARNEIREKQQAGKLDIDELRRYDSHLKRLANAIISQKLRLKELDIRIEDQRQVLLKASQDKKIYEKLKEKHKEVFLQEQEDEERKFIDELATSRYRREGGEHNVSI
jgi:flagellar protein FliJ